MGKARIDALALLEPGGCWVMIVVLVAPFIRNTL
jgi:hypothetical protein